MTLCYWAEGKGNPIIAALGVDQRASELQSGGNMEGKEVRFGIANSALFTTVTTDASCGAVNNMHDSLTPLAGMVPLVNILLGRDHLRRRGRGAIRHAAVRDPGGVHRRADGRPHAGVSRQEDRGQEVKMAMLAILILPASILGFTALATVAKDGLAGRREHRTARLQ